MERELRYEEEPTWVLRFVRKGDWRLRSMAFPDSASMERFVMEHELSAILVSARTTLLAGTPNGKKLRA
jgi:hypothetical protein